MTEVQPTYPHKAAHNEHLPIHLPNLSPHFSAHFSLKADIRTVYSVLEDKEGLGLLEDSDTAAAIDAVTNAGAYGDEAPSRASLEARTRAKAQAIERLCGQIRAIV